MGGTVILLSDKSYKKPRGWEHIQKRPHTSGSTHRTSRKETHKGDVLGQGWVSHVLEG